MGFVKRSQRMTAQDRTDIARIAEAIRVSSVDAVDFNTTLACTGLALQRQVSLLRKYSGPIAEQVGVQGLQYEPARHTREHGKTPARIHVYRYARAV